jgi:hypothetical protein
MNYFFSLSCGKKLEIGRRRRYCVGREPVRPPNYLGAGQALFAPGRSGEPGNEAEGFFWQETSEKEQSHVGEDTTL